jgi:hypothetical protein
MIRKVVFKMGGGAKIIELIFYITFSPLLLMFNLSNLFETAPNLNPCLELIKKF